MSRAPRYDVPTAAPAPLRLVQAFVNTVDLEHGREWLSDPAALANWGREWKLMPAGTRLTRRDLRRALELREALRALLVANRNGAPTVRALNTLSDAARSARLTVTFADGDVPTLVPQAKGIESVLGRLVAITAVAMLDGSWTRLKACRNCRWAFYDESKNRSAHWCSMALCGNRLKTRAYRRRQSTEAKTGRS